MPALTREVVFGRLGTLAMQTLQAAFEFASSRQDSYIEPVHWLSLWLRTDGSDVQEIVEQLELPRAQLLNGVEDALGRLGRRRSSRLDFSGELELMIERGWISASLVFGGARIRTGHLLHGMLEDAQLRRLLVDVSPLFKKIDGPTLAARFDDLTRRSQEEVGEQPLAPAFNAAAAAPGSPPADGATAETALAMFTTDLTAEALAGRLDIVTGRDAEVRQMVDILMRRRQNNPIIVGEAGVGKTALVEGLALKIAAGDVPPVLKDVRILALDLAAMQAGASVRGEFENRLRTLTAEVQKSARPIVLFIDEAHMLIGTSGANGTGDAANLLKPALARGTLRTIAATTWDEYKRHIEKDPALTRRFQVVQVEEPAEAQAIAMLRNMADIFRSHHGVEVLDEAIAAAVRLSHRYMPGRQLPDKAVSVLDTACARVAMSQHAEPADLEDARRRITDIERELGGIERERRIGIPAPDRAAWLERELAEERLCLNRLEERAKREQKLVAEILELQAALREKDADSELPRLQSLQAELKDIQDDVPLVLPAVDEQAVAAIIGSWTGIPVGRMVADEIDAVLDLGQTLKSRVIGQDHALDAIAKRILTARAGLDDPARPKGVFLLVGPSGVGKTETALALAENLFGSDENVIAINMSEFQEAHTVSRLQGAPPGYVGYGEGGRLTEAVRRKPYSVILLDEFEKAHPDVHELFFQVFDKGVMEDGEGRRIDFKNTIILLTSNVGSDDIIRACAAADRLPHPEHLADLLRRPLLQVFPAALLGRLVTVPYYPLSDSMLDRLIRMQLERIKKRIRSSRNVPFSYDDAVVAHVRARCNEVESGGRMIHAILTNTLLPTISREVLERMRSQQPLVGIHVGIDKGDFVYDFA